MYQRAMGESFGRLASPVQRFHRLHGRHTLQGWVETDAPATALARLLARCMGTPADKQSGPILFELDAGLEEETWTRRFPLHTMSSRIRLTAGQVVEHLGLARLTFDLREVEGNLEMRLRRLLFLGIPCPRWLMPRLIATETGDGGQFHFCVQAAVPLLGVVAGYRGTLRVPDEAST
jgi:Domain of unknown function (DUF4166)